MPGPALREFVARIQAANAGSRALFAGLGFRETVLKAHPGYDAPTTVRMEKPLPPGGAG